MCDFQAIADRCDIETPRAEFTDAAMMHDSHHGTIRLEGDAAAGRTYITEFGLLRDGSSHRNFAVCNDRYQRTPDGWKFSERVYKIRYLDTTPLTGSAPDAAELARLGQEQLRRLMQLESQ
jgi:hypothetical protein